jgi:hypothetical protein
MFAFDHTVGVREGLDDDHAATVRAVESLV